MLSGNAPPGTQAGGQNSALTEGEGMTKGLWTLFVLIVLPDISVLNVQYKPIPVCRNKVTDRWCYL